MLAVGINGMKKIVAGSRALQQRPEFRRVNNLCSLDVLAGEPWPLRPPVPLLRPASCITAHLPC